MNITDGTTFSQRLKIVCIKCREIAAILRIILLVYLAFPVVVIISPILWLINGFDVCRFVRHIADKYKIDSNILNYLPK